MRKLIIFKLLLREVTMSKDSLNAEEEERIMAQVSAATQVSATKGKVVKLELSGKKINVEMLEKILKKSPQMHLDLNIKDIKINSIDELMALYDQYGPRCGNTTKAFTLCVKGVKQAFSNVDKSKLGVKISDNLMKKFHFNGEYMSYALEHMMSNEKAYKFPIDEQAEKILKHYTKSEWQNNKEIKEVLSKWGNAKTKNMCDNAPLNQAKGGLRKIKEQALSISQDVQLPKKTLKSKLESLFK